MNEVLFNGNFQQETFLIISVLDIQTELLILAHLCYSAVCNMEGISNVLRAARVMTVWMEKEGEFTNMVSRVHVPLYRNNQGWTVIANWYRTGK